MLRMIAQSLIDKIKALFKSVFTDDQGNVEVGKDLVVDGTITQNSYVLDEDITVSNLPTNLNCNYAHARISNGKLNIVAAFWKSASITKSVEVQIGHISIPSWAGEKLYSPEAHRLIGAQKYQWPDTDSSASMLFLVIKSSNTTLDMSIIVDADSTSQFSIMRYEMNFILS